MPREERRPPGPNPGYRDYLDLIRGLDELIAALQEHPDEAVRERSRALLTGLDALHREGLQRLVDALAREGEDDILQRATEDPVVRTLLGLYDLADLDLPAPPEASSSGPMVGFVPEERLRRASRSAGRGTSSDS